MGKRGTKPKPVELKVANGTYRKDRHGDLKDAVKTVGLPVKPIDISPEEAAIWDEIVPQLVQMGVAKQIDTPMLVEMCFWLERCRAMQAVIRKIRGAEVSKDYYRIQISAAHAFKCFDRVAMRFGMTASDRATLKAEEPKETGIRRRERA